MSEEVKDSIRDTTAPDTSDHASDKASKPVPNEFNARAVLAIFGSVCSLFISIGFVNAFGVFQQYYHEHQLRNKSEFDIAWIGSFSTFVMFLFGAPAGLLVDRVGPRPLIAGGSVCLLLGTFMTSLCKQYYQYFLAQGLLMGAAMSFLTIPCVATLSRHFTKHRGLATGLCISGSSLGGVIWPIVCDQLLNHHDVSFGWTMRIVGFIMIPLTIFSSLTVRVPAGKLPLKDHETGATSTPTPDPGPKKKLDLSIVKNPVYIVFVIGATIFNLGMFSPFFFTTSYSASLGHSASFSFYILSIMNAASLFGRVGVGILADYWGCFNFTCTAALSGTIVAYCWTAARSEAELVVWGCAYGFSSGAVLSLQMQCVSALSTKETYGTAVGLAMAFISIASLIGSPISGELLPRGYLALSMYAASTLLVGSLILVVCRFMQERRVWAKV